MGRFKDETTAFPTPQVAKHPLNKGYSSTVTITHDYNKCALLAAERGYSYPELHTRDGRTVLTMYTLDGCGVVIDYVNEILVQHRLVPFNHDCPDWKEAARLLSLLTPARGVVDIEPDCDSMHPEGF